MVGSVSLSVREAEQPLRGEWRIRYVYLPYSYILDIYGIEIRIIRVHCISYQRDLKKSIWNILFSVTNSSSFFFFSILIVNHPCSVTNTKCKPDISLSFLVKHLATVDFQCCNYSHWLSDWSSKFKTLMALFHHGFVRMHNKPNFVSIIHMDFI